VALLTRLPCRCLPSNAGDGEKLFNDYGVFAANLVELGGVANQVDPAFAAKFKRQMVALAKMVEFYEQKLLPKGSVRSSDWETVPLTEEQLECEYRLIDTVSFAHICSKMRQTTHTALW
jgi:hypothetical protein